MTDSIFTSQVPSLTDANDSTRYTLCTLWTPAVDGTVTHGRWYFPATQPSRAPVFALFERSDDSTGTLLGTATFSLAGYAAGWRTVALAPAISVTAGHFYYASVKTEDRYVATTGFFSGSSVVSGNLTAPADDAGTPRRNGRFNDFGTIDVPDYPDSGGGASYFADVVFDAGALPSTPGTLTAATAAGAFSSVSASNARLTNTSAGGDA